MRLYRRSVIRSIALLATMAVLWSGHLCALAGSASAAPGEAFAAIASHEEASDTVPENRTDDEDCDACDHQDQPACPRATVCCLTWATTSRVTLPAPTFKTGFSPLVAALAHSGRIHQEPLDRSVRVTLSSESPPKSPTVPGPASSRAPPTQ